jgi:glycogen operon protein
MLLAGDEFGRSQQGNNNAYCQDNELSWVDWEGVDSDGETLASFVTHLLALRREFPLLRRKRFLTGEWVEALGVKDVTWLGAAGSELTDTDWQDPTMRCFGMLLDGRAQASAIVKAANDRTLLLLLNAWHEDVDFTLPPPIEGSQWQVLVDTAQPDGRPQDASPPQATLRLQGRSMQLLASGR